MLISRSKTIKGVAKKLKEQKHIGVLKEVHIDGGRCATRTRDLWFRRPTLYPPELIAHRNDLTLWFDVVNK
jgi:hypothetical protein